MGGHESRLNLVTAIYRIPLTDYRRASYGVLVASGAGIMMALMDACERFRYCVDIDQCRGREEDLVSWVKALDRNELVDLIAVAGWFSITSPKKIADALTAVRAPAIVYSGAGLGASAFSVPVFDTLEDFLGHVANPLRPGHRDERQQARIFEHPPERALEPLASVSGHDVG